MERERERENAEMKLLMFMQSYYILLLLLRESPPTAHSFLLHCSPAYLFQLTNLGWKIRQAAAEEVG